MAGPRHRPQSQAPRRQRAGPRAAQLARRVAGHPGQGHRLISFKVTIYSIEPRKRRKTTYRVRWVVAGNRFGESFAIKQLAEAYRASLITAAGNGEGFDIETGLPVSMERKRRDVTFYQHALDFTAAVWPAVAAKTRVSIIETLARVVPVVVRDLAGATRPGRPPPGTEEAAQPERARGRAGPGRGEGHRVDYESIPARQRLRGRLRGLRRARRPGRQARRQARRPRVLLPAPPGAAPRPRLRGTQETARQEPAEQRQPARRLDTPASPGRHRRPARGRQPGPGRRHAASLRHHRQAAGPALHSVLRLHVLRADAPLRGRRAHPRSLSPARHRMGPPDLRRRQPRRRPGLHRRRPGPRAPRPQRPHQGQAHPESPQARPESPDPARARRAAARPHSPSSA